MLKFSRLGNKSNSFLQKDVLRVNFFTSEGFAIQGSDGKVLLAMKNEE